MPCAADFECCIDATLEAIVRSITRYTWRASTESVSSAPVADRLDISQRKKDHLALCAGPNVGFREKTTLLECVEFMHDSLPEMHADEVDSSTTLLGHRLAAPIIVAAMTGGTDRAAEVNRDIARAADELGLAFGLGSQRAMFVRPETTWTFQIRDVAPNVLLLGNLGVVQARTMSTQQITDLCATVGADALCIHLNPAMEIVQPGGDRDFSQGLETLARLAAELGIPVIAKETGCGLSRRSAVRIAATGVKAVDTSGAGGTSWVAVEAHRAVDEDDKAIAEELWDWGIPTAASVLQLSGLPLEIIATGGLKTGTDVARAVALGATCGGIASQVLRAHAGAKAYLHRTMLVVRAIMLLCGCRTVDALRRTPTIIREPLASWRPEPHTG